MAGLSAELVKTWVLHTNIHAKKIFQWACDAKNIVNFELKMGVVYTNGCGLGCGIQKWAWFKGVPKIHFMKLATM